MNLIISEKKPDFSGHDIDYSLCTFRTSKLYLWTLVKFRLNEICSLTSQNSLRVLDAACHSLITRKIFPDSFIYYGLDISRQRLHQAFTIKRPSDHLYLADLTKNLNLNQCFDVVVSLNTMSHLPLEQRLSSLSNLIAVCVRGADLILNIPIDSQLMHFTHKLLKSFKSVEVVYFDSFFSKKFESSNQINVSNITSFFRSNELSLPNDASFHSQVLLHGRTCLSSSESSIIPPDSLSSTFLSLNKIPHVMRLDFSSDTELSSVCPCWDPSSVILFSDFLFHSQYGSELVALLDTYCSLPICAISEFSPPSSPFYLYVFGLETEWIGDVPSVRFAINGFRELSTIVQINFIIVKSRRGYPCFPSVVAHDA